MSVVTDTTASLPAELVEENGIGVVSLYLVFGGDRVEREDKLMLDLPSLYDELRSIEQWPTTSQPSVGDFIDVYEPLLAAGDAVVSIHLSAALSGTLDAARQAAESLARDGKGGERIHVVDSATAAGGVGLLALAAAREARAGADVDGVTARARDVRSALKMWFAVDTLEFLRRSGRIGAASAWIGSTLKVKPILTVESELMPVERVRTAGRALERLVDYARQRHDSGADAWVVQHIQAPDEVDVLVGRCREIFGHEPVWVSEIGPVLGVHTGPGLLGVGAIPARLLE